MSHTAVVARLGVLMSLSAISIDITLPALPTMARDFAEPIAKAQWTISLYFIALGVGQLLWGPLSDRYGRRPILAMGIGLFSCASLAAAFAPTIEALIAIRVIQGFGAASAMAVTRAMLRDLFVGDELARALGLAMAIFAVGPLFAPFIGAGLLVVLDWHAIFVGLAVIGIGALVLVRTLPETLQTQDASALRPTQIARNLGELAQCRQSRWFLALAPFAMAPMVVMLAMLPAVYAREFGIEGFAFSALFASHGLGIIVGQIINRRVISRIGTLDAMLIGAGVLTSVGAAITVLALVGWIGIFALTALFILFATAFLVVIANATSLYLTPHGRIAGLATAVFTAAAQFGAGVIVSLIVALTAPTTLWLGLSILGLCVITLAGGMGYRADMKKNASESGGIA